MSENWNQKEQALAVYKFSGVSKMVGNSIGNRATRKVYCTIYFGITYSQAVDVRGSIKERIRNG